MTKRLSWWRRRKKERRQATAPTPLYRLYATIMADCAARKRLPCKVSVRHGDERVVVIFEDEMGASERIGFGADEDEDKGKKDETKSDKK